MKTISFTYETKHSSIFQIIKRPIAEISFLSPARKKWLKYIMIVDTGADYTIFPFKVASDLGIDVEKDCTQHFTRGIGGSEKVYIYNKNILMKIGNFKKGVPIGFLERDDIPPLLGRHKCLDLFDMLFSNFTTSFKRI